jgi:hypothetical protein
MLNKYFVPHSNIVHSSVQYLQYSYKRFSLGDLLELCGHPSFHDHYYEYSRLFSSRRVDASHLV